MNYKEYRFTMWELVQIFFLSLVVTAVIALLFYRSYWTILGSPLVFGVLFKRVKEQKIVKRKNSLQEEFLSGIRVLNASLQAGLSMENAWQEVEKDLRLMFGERSNFYNEVKEMNHQIQLNVPLEKLFLELAYRTGLEDVVSFAEVLDYGKRNGGNWKKIIDATVERMCEKQDARKEIEVMVAGKKMEQQVMNIIPLGILAFLQISSWDYMSVLYHNPLGVICMTICLCGYGGAIYLSEKILQIKV